MNRTPIEWTHWSANAFKMRMPDGTLINVCVHKSDGCRNCYAEMIVRRFWKKEYGAFPGYTAALLKLGTPVIVEAELQAVLRLSERIAKGKADPEINKVFWHDMTDEYLDFWPDEFIDKCWAVRALTPNLIHQVLTKRPERMRARLESISKDKSRGYWFGEIGYLTDLAISSGLTTKEDAHRRFEEWRRKHRPDLPDEPENIGDTVAYKPRWPLSCVHVGTSVEDQKTADERIPLLMETSAAVRWISAEPLLGLIDLESVPTTEGSIDWVVVGGESGTQARPMHPDWARSLRDQCAAAGVPFFFKQWGEWLPYADVVNSVCGLAVHEFKNDRVYRIGKKAAGRLLDGREWSQFPEAQAKTVTA